MDEHRKPPETTGTRWIPIAEVEELIGKKERNARYWLERHDIPFRGERPKLFSEQAIATVLASLGQEHRKPPEHPPEYPPEGTGKPPETTGIHAAPIEAQYTSITPAEIERAIERTSARYVADFASLYDRIAGEVGGLYEAQLAAKDETIATQRELIAHQGEILADARDRLAELSRRAEAAEAERDQLRAQAAPQPPHEAATVAAPDDAPDAPAPAGGFWQRLRRAFGGE